MVDIDYVAETTATFRAMTPMRRNCYLPDQKQLSFFPSYSESNCLLECAWSLAKETCSCVPWYLSKYYPDANLCEFHGKSCFDSIVDKRFDRVENENGEESGTTCQKECLRDCQSVYYSVKTEMTPSQESSLRGKTKYNQLYYDYVTVNKTAADPTVVQDIKTSFFLQKPQITHMAMIHVYIAKRTTLEMVATATATVIDMISNIGGTLGLFLGFSILSGFEMFYWMGKSIFEGMNKNKTGHTLKGTPMK